MKRCRVLLAAMMAVAVAWMGVGCGGGEEPSYVKGEQAQTIAAEAIRLLQSSPAEKGQYIIQAISSTSSRSSVLSMDMQSDVKYWMDKETVVDDTILIMDASVSMSSQMNIQGIESSTETTAKLLAGHASFDGPEGEYLCGSVQSTNAENLRSESHCATNLPRMLTLPYLIEVLTGDSINDLDMDMITYTSLEEYAATLVKVTSGLGESLSAQQTGEKYSFRILWQDLTQEDYALMAELVGDVALDAMLEMKPNGALTYDVTFQDGEWQSYGMNMEMQIGEGASAVEMLGNSVVSRRAGFADGAQAFLDEHKDKENFELIETSAFSAWYMDAVSSSLSGGLV